MMYSSEFIFIHIPRTGGTALTAFFGGHVGISKDVHFNKHITALQFKNLLNSDSWDHIYKFTLFRNPVDIVVSWYNHVLSSFEVLDRRKVTKEWFDYCNKIKLMSFDEFVDLELEKLVKKGGFLNHWCNTVDDIDILNFDGACKYLSNITGIQVSTNTLINTSNRYVEYVSDSNANKIIDWCYLDDKVYRDKVRNRQRQHRMGWYF